MIDRLLLTLLLFSFVGIGHTNEDPWLIINKAANATKFLNYKGVFHSQHDKEITWNRTAWTGCSRRSGI